MSFLINWLRDPWRRGINENELLLAYQQTFGSVQGQMVLHDLVDKFLAVYGVPNDDSQRHLGRTDVVLAILANIDMAAHPEKYRPQVIR